MSKDMKLIMEAFRKLQAEQAAVPGPRFDFPSERTQEVISMAREIGAIIEKNNLRALKEPFRAFMEALQTAPEDGGFYNE